MIQLGMTIDEYSYPRLVLYHLLLLSCIYHITTFTQNNYHSPISFPFSLIIKKALSFLQLRAFLLFKLRTTGIGPISCLLNKPVFPVRRLILKTSTYVEKATLYLLQMPKLQDHLHTCGENLSSIPSP